MIDLLLILGHHFDIMDSIIVISALPLLSDYDITWSSAIVLSNSSTVDLLVSVFECRVD